MHRAALAVLVAAIALPVAATGPGPSEVAVSGKQLIVRKRQPDGVLAPAAPYAIRGVVWSPASKTTNTYPGDPMNAAVRRPQFATWASTDVPLLAAMNVNTIRMLIDPGPDAAGRSVLDQLYASGIMVVMTVDDAINDTARVAQVVNFYKDHPAVLMWNLGSEWNINLYFGAASSMLDAAERTQRAAALIESIDPNHPIVSSYGEIDINDSGRRLSDTAHYVNDVCPSIDIWALNIYRGRSFGNLFDQWAVLTPKPMLLGEFGTDAFRSAGSTSAGSADGVMQADWNVAQWNEIFGHLSANTPEAGSLGGFVFALSDEWWKVPATVGSQNSGGYAGAQPDDFANEEWFGIADIDRVPRPAYAALAAAFDPSYQPPSKRPYRVISRGAVAEEFSSQYGVVWMFQDAARIYRKTGGAGGGRGFSVAVFDPATGAAWQPPQVFDTWGASHQGNGAFCAMRDFLDGVPDGMLLAIGVADEAGLTEFPPSDCQPRNVSCTLDVRQRLQALGSQQLGSYCYRGSWAMTAVKGEAVARQESLNNSGEASSRTTLPSPVRTLTLTMSGSGAVRSVPAGVQCNATCSTPLPFDRSVTLHALPALGSYFAGWSGACSGNEACTVMMSAAVGVVATFEAGSSVAPRAVFVDPSGEMITLTVSAEEAVPGPLPRA